MNLPDYLSGSKTDRSLFGLTMEQISIAQSRADYLFLDYVLSQHQEIKRVVEFGTFRGLTTLCLGIAMAFRGGDVITFDKPGAGQLEARVSKLWPNNVLFISCDVLHEIDVITQYFRPEMLLICDNGYKAVEALLYASLLPKNSIMMVHDKNIEFDEAELVAEVELEQIYQDVGLMFGSSHLVLRN